MKTRDSEEERIEKLISELQTPWENKLDNLIKKIKEKRKVCNESK